MKRRIVCLLLTAVMLLGLLPFTAMNASADTTMTISDEAIACLKTFEGFLKYPKWDYAQYSIGYGTKCPADKFEYYKANGITEAEAEALMRDSLEYFEQEVNTKLIGNLGLEFTQNQYDALVLFSYNCGTAWMTTVPGDFRQSVIDGDTGNDFIYNMVRWSTVLENGVKVPDLGLIRRRLCEADMYLNGNYTTQKSYRKNYTYILLDNNGGVNNIEMQGYDYNDPTVVKPVPSRTGYRFMGWYTEETGGAWITTLDASTAGATLHAHWQQEEGNVDADGNVLGSNVSYSWPASHISSLNVYAQPKTGAEVLDVVDEGDSLSITADYVDERDIKWGKLQQGGWVILGSPVATETINTERAVDVKVTNAYVNVRLTPGVDGSFVGKVYYMEELTIYKTTTVDGELWGKYSGGWICLKYTDYANALENLENADAPVIATGYVVANNYLRIRSGAGVSFAEVGKLLPGDEVKLIQIKKVGTSEWGRIEQGWICLDYVQYTMVSGEDDETPEQGGNTQQPEDTQKPAETVLRTGTVINTDALRVRSGAGTDKPEVTRLTSGTKLNFYEFETVKGVEWGRTDLGWVCMTYIKLDPTAEELENAVTGVVISNQNLNIRSQAGVSHTLLGSLPNGTKVTIFEQTIVNNVAWGRIDQGWICLQYVRLDEPAEEKPEGGETEQPGEGETEQPGEGEKPETPVLRTGTVINTDALRVRSGAGTDKPEVTRLTSGTKLNFYEFETVKGVEWGRTDLGWVCMTYIKLNPTAEELENAVTGVVISNQNLNIRSQAGVSHTLLGSLPNGTKVTIYEQTVVNGVAWGRIDQGWICLQYVRLDEPAEEKPEGGETEQPGEGETEQPGEGEEEKPGETVLCTGTVINTDALRVRSGAGTQYAEVTRLKSGTKLNFYEFETVKGVEWGRTDLGWVCLSYIKLDPTQEELDNAVKGVVISNSPLNIRSNPGIQHTLLGSLPNGTEVTIFEITEVKGEKWGRIDRGWICMSYVQLIEETPKENETDKPGEGETEQPGEGEDETNIPVLEESVLEAFAEGEQYSYTYPVADMTLSLLSDGTCLLVCEEPDSTETYAQMTYYYLGTYESKDNGAAVSCEFDKVYMGANLTQEQKQEVEAELEDAYAAGEIGKSVYDVYCAWLRDEIPEMPYEETEFEKYTVDAKLLSGGKFAPEKIEDHSYGSVYRTEFKEDTYVDSVLNNGKATWVREYDYEGVELSCRYYDYENGVLVSSSYDEYYPDGSLKLAEWYDANGNIEERDTYTKKQNADGTWPEEYELIVAEVYEDGKLYCREEYVQGILESIYCSEKYGMGAFQYWLSEDEEQVIKYVYYIPGTEATKVFEAGEGNTLEWTYTCIEDEDGNVTVAQIELYELNAADETVHYWCMSVDGSITEEGPQG